MTTSTVASGTEGDYVEVLLFSSVPRRIRSSHGSEGQGSVFRKRLLNQPGLEAGRSCSAAALQAS